MFIHEKTVIKGKKLLGIVESVKESPDTLVRACNVRYTIPNPKDPVNKYTGGKNVVVSRSIQRLSLLLPIEEQNPKLRLEKNVLVKVEDSSAVSEVKKS